MPDTSRTRMQTSLRQRMLTTMGVERLRMLIDTANDDDPRNALAAAAELRRQSEGLQDIAVRRARNAGISWAEIARHLGVTKQSAHRKYGGRTLGRDRRT